MITAVLRRRINNTSTDSLGMCNSHDDKEMCRYIVGKIIWEEMKHTDIQMPEWMIKLKKHRIVQRDVEKNKKML
jgi:hypothetical protein